MFFKAFKDPIPSTNLPYPLSSRRRLVTGPLSCSELRRIVAEMLD